MKFNISDGIISIPLDMGMSIIENVEVIKKQGTNVKEIKYNKKDFFKRSVEDILEENKINEDEVLLINSDEDSELQMLTNGVFAMIKGKNWVENDMNSVKINGYLMDDECIKHTTIDLGSGGKKHMGDTSRIVYHK